MVSEHSPVELVAFPRPQLAVSINPQMQTGECQSCAPPRVRRYSSTHQERSSCFQAAGTAQRAGVDAWHTQGLGLPPPPAPDDLSNATGFVAMAGSSTMGKGLKQSIQKKQPFLLLSALGAQDSYLAVDCF